MNVSVIIINYNTSEYLKACLDSIIQYTQSLNFEIIVIDNNSTDRRIENLAYEYKSVKFILRDINDGFGAGCNYGAAQATGKYLLFLNPDILLTDNALYNFFIFMEKNSHIGLCSGLLTDSNGNAQYTYNYFPSISWEFKEAISRKTDERIKELLDRILLDHKQESFEVDWVMGACMFIRSELFHTLKGFDESLFLYYEDVDLEYRLSILKFKIVVLPGIYLIHHERSSVSSENGKNVYFYNMHKSKIRYMQKHFNFFKRNIIRILFITGMTLRIISLPFRKNSSGYNKEQSLNVLKMYINKFN